VASLCALFFFWGHGSSWADTVAVATSMRNFPGDRGLVMGLVKSSFGLSAGFYTLTYQAWLFGNLSGLMTFLSVFSASALLALAPACAVLPPARTTKLLAPDVRKVYTGYALNLVIAGYVAAVSALRAASKLPSMAPYGAALLPLLALALVQLAPSHLFGCGLPEAERRAAKAAAAADAAAAVAAAAAAAATVAGSAAASSGGDDDGVDGAQQQLPLLRVAGGRSIGGADELMLEEASGAVAAVAPLHAAAAGGRHASMAAPLAGGGGGGGGGGDAAARVPGATLVEALLSPDFWLLMFVLFAGTGAGITLINQVGSMAKSLAAPGDEQDLDVTLLAVANCLGRMLFGAASEATAHRLSRAAWLVAACASMVGAMALAAAATTATLPLATAWAGFSYGGFWSLGPALLADRFGSAQFGAIYAVSSLATAAGSFSLNVGLATAVYRANIADGGGADCFGAACFRLTFLVLAALTATAAAAAAVLAVRLRSLYVGVRGAAVAYDAYAAARGGNGPCVAAAQRALLARGACGACACGRRLVGEPREDDGADLSFYAAKTVPVDDA
jgi:hypothetical protein